VFEETFTIGGNETGDTFGAEDAPIYRYSATLGAPVELAEGWVSILGSPGGDPECWFLWHSSTDNNEKSVGRDLDNPDQLEPREYDLSICLNGTYVSLTGSCCDDLTGACDDDVEVVDCPIDNRFTVGTLCADLNPPCGPQVGPGACCVDGDCNSPVEESDCDALGGFFYRAEDCASFTCPADVVYHKDFDGDTGMGDWSGEWGLTSTESYSVPSSMADSPSGNYADSDTVVVELGSDVNLIGYAGFTLEFMTKFAIESGSDFCYLDVSTDNGANWINLYVFNGEDEDDFEWHLFSSPLQFYETDLRLRLTLETNAEYTTDGQYIDDIFIYGDPIDTSPPLILHDGATTYTSVPHEYTAEATITDFSGIAEATINYTVDGGEDISIGPDQVAGDLYTFIIPQQEAGAHVNYYISATDNVSNTGFTPDYRYISGTVVYYDDNEPEFTYQFTTDNKVAVRFTPEEPAMLVTGMFRLFTDFDNPLDYVDVEVWADDGFGLPGASIHGPTEVYPQSDLDNPQAWTYVDYRGTGIDFATADDFHLGYTYRSQWPVILGDSPMVTNRSNQDLGDGWVAATTDFHIRAVVVYNYGACCDEENDECTMTYESQCQFTFSLGQTCQEVGCGAVCGHYVVGDYNCSGSPNVADVVDMYSKLKTGAPVYPDCECDCLGDGDVWPVGGDVNSSCAMNVADVVDLYSKLKTGSPELTPCMDCPPDSWLNPGGGDRPLVVPNLESKAKLKTGSGMD
jgi:hypothetical protein